jgi:phosphatidylserine decarboxylase
MVLYNAPSRSPPIPIPLSSPALPTAYQFGWFEHGSTIIVMAPEHFEFAGNVADGARIRAGEALLRKPSV